MPNIALREILQLIAGIIALAGPVMGMVNARSQGKLNRKVDDQKAALEQRDNTQQLLIERLQKNEFRLQQQLNEKTAEIRQILTEVHDGEDAFKKEEEILVTQPELQNILSIHTQSISAMFQKISQLEEVIKKNE